MESVMVGEDRDRVTRRPRADTNQVAELFTRWRQHGDARARQELVSRYLPLARKLASRYTSPHEPFEDLVQVASIGLIGAVDRFDPGRGVEFSSFAIPTILGELKRYFRSTGWSAHVPRRAQELALRVEKASRHLAGRPGSLPSVAEIAEYLELSTEEVLTGIDAGSAHYSVSLDAPPAGADRDPEPETLAEKLGDEDQRFGMIEASISMAAALRHLPHLERQALSLRLNADMKQTEIAQQLGCSQMQVSRLLRRAARRLTDLIDPSLTPAAD
jgi:RNA polymerase sigma-B factor